MIDLLEKRRSIRKYLDKQVEQSKINAVLESALLSPSSRGINPWEFIVITDKALLNKLSLSKKGAEFLKSSPLGIVVMADTTKSDVWIEDCSICSTILLLSAEYIGLGACWIQISNRMHSNEMSAEEYVRSLLDIPDSYSVLSIISIGYPNEKLPANKVTEQLKNKIHNTKFYSKK